MRRIAFLGSVLAAASLFSSGCGYIEGPQTPLANVPTPVRDLAAVQRGGIIIAHFTVPHQTTENHPIGTPIHIDLRIGTAGAPFDPEEWASHAKVLSDATIQQGLATFRIPSAEWAGKEAILGVRVTGPNGKHADWSNYQVIPVVSPPEVPSHVNLENTAIGVRVTWTGAGDHFRILRRAGAESDSPLVATVEGHEWTDPVTEYGKPYAYVLQALVDLSERKVAESDLTAPYTITPEDKFPPAPPTSLRAVPSSTSIELAWDRSPDADCAGYRVYRAVGDGAFEKLADVGEIPNYSDTTTETGKSYRYAVSARDRTGNESAKSDPVQAVRQ